MSVPPKTTFVAEPFDGVDGRRPPRSTKKAPSLRASVAERLAPAAANHHVPPKPEPWQRVDTTREPESIAHAVQMREALKRRIAALHERLRAMNRHDKQRDGVAHEAREAQKRSGELSVWARRQSGAVSERCSSSTITSLLAILDRLQDEGVPLTDGDHAVMDDAAEFVAWSHEQAGIRRALNSGQIPVVADE